MNGTTAKPADRKQTVKAVLDAAAEARREVRDKADALHDRAEVVKDFGYDRELTDAEKNELRQIAAALGALATTERELALATVRSLDQTDEVKRLVNVLKAATDNLDQDLRQVQGVAKQVKRLGDLFKRLEQVTKVLVKLAALV